MPSMSVRADVLAKSAEISAVGVAANLSAPFGWADPGPFFLLWISFVQVEREGGTAVSAFRGQIARKLAGPSGGQVAKVHPGRVIIVGAGPTGLLLAAELALAGIGVLVLERRAAQREDSRAICLHARTVEALDLRGQGQLFARTGLPVPAFPLGPRGAVIKFGMLDSDFPVLLDMPQGHVERLLLDWGARLGVQVRWSSAVTGLAADDEGVTVSLADGGSERASYVVGCDGVRSFVRDAAAIPFPGMHNPGSVILADLRLAGLPMDRAYGDLSPAGMLLVFPFRDGTCRVVLYDYSLADVPVTEPVTLEEVTASLRRVAGRDFGPHGLYWAGRYRSESRQAPAYRAGRILLAGDAAHAHSPAGAQGMNTGLQDSVNLGWKLAADLNGWAPSWLLDSYHSERYPVGAAVLALSGRQFALNTAKTPARRLLRWAVHRLVVPLPPVQARLARDYSGLSISYPPAPWAPTPVPGGGVAPPSGQDPLAGTRLPPGLLTLAGGAGGGTVTAAGPGAGQDGGTSGSPDGGTVRLYELFTAGQFVLLDRESGERPGDIPSHVRLVRYTGRLPGRLPAAVLARPDGYIAWASDEPDPAARARAAADAVRRWCTPG
jgi:2-polyprenyl-6-methoxyphenol hydroxylase-like FAD-dependent oxidoreductase